jgi:hypothetical protein
MSVTLTSEELSFWSNKLDSAKQIMEENKNILDEIGVIQTNDNRLEIVNYEKFSSGNTYHTLIKHEENLIAISQIISELKGFYNSLSSRKE